MVAMVRPPPAPVATWATKSPAVSAQEEDVGVDEGAEAAIDTAVPAEPSPATEVVSPPSTDPANDDQRAEDLPATGTE